MALSFNINVDESKKKLARLSEGMPRPLTNLTKDSWHVHFSPSTFQQESIILPASHPITRLEKTLPNERTSRPSVKQRNFDASGGRKYVFEVFNVTEAPRDWITRLHEKLRLRDVLKITCTFGWRENTPFDSWRLGWKRNDDDITSVGNEENSAVGRLNQLVPHERLSQQPPVGGVDF